MAEKWRSEKIRQPWAVADKLADALRAEIPAGVEFHFGGSYRRKAETVGDLDVVIVTKDGTFGDVILPLSVDYQRRGDKVAQGDLTVDGVTMHVDFWACSESERGAFLWFITGPKELNIAMRQEAIKLGLNLSQTGLWRGGVKEKGQLVGGEQVDNGTEYSVASWLGNRWIQLLEPQRRETWAKPQGKVETRQIEGSKGAIYEIKIDGHRVSCSCPGNKYRGNCKHADKVREELEQR